MIDSYIFLISYHIIFIIYHIFSIIYHISLIMYHIIFNRGYTINITISRVIILITRYFPSLMAAEIALSLGSVIALITLIQHFI